MPAGRDESVHHLVAVLGDLFAIAVLDLFAARNQLVLDAADGLIYN